MFIPGTNNVSLSAFKHMWENCSCLLGLQFNVFLKTNSELSSAIKKERKNKNSQYLPKVLK